MTPTTVFLIDGLGAAATAVGVGVILPRLEGYVGMPRSVLHALALAAAAFAVYSLGCAAARVVNWPPYLRAIAIANTLYCVVTLGCLGYFRDALKALDWVYFLGEIAIIVVLVRTELRLATAGNRVTPL